MRRPPAEAPPEPVEDLTSRGDVKRANRVVEESLARLSKTLCEIAPKKLAALELPESVEEAVRDSHPMKDPRARKRQMGLVRVALRNTDWAAIQERVRYRLEGRAPPAPAADGQGPVAGAGAMWVARLLGEGFVGLDAFLAEHPRTDRARLVELIKRVDRGTGDQRAKAERKLADVVANILASDRR